MQKQKVGFGLMAISAIGLALGTILMKQIPLRTSMTPGHVAVWRFAISAPLMWLITLTRQKKSERPQEKVWALIGLGLIYSAASLSALLALGQLSSSL